MPGLKEGKGFPDYSRFQFTNQKIIAKCFGKTCLLHFRKEALTIALQRQGFDAK